MLREDSGSGGECAGCSTHGRWLVSCASHAIDGTSSGNGPPTRTNFAVLNHGPFKELYVKSSYVFARFALGGAVANTRYKEAMRLLFVVGRGALGFGIVVAVGFILNLMIPGWTDRESAWWPWASWAFIILFDLSKEIERLAKPNRNSEQPRQTGEPR